MNEYEIFQGIIRGATIELTTILPMPDGAKVDVTVKPAKMSAEQRREKLKSLFGSCEADSDDLDQFLVWNDQQRKRCRAAPSP